MTMSTKTEFLIPDMTCGHCVKTITAAVHRVSPAASVTAQTDTHRVTVEGAADPAALLAAIKAEGYQPSLLPMQS
jgi:copper chaperone